MALEVELVRLVRVGVAPGEELFLLTRQARSKLAGDLLGQLALDAEDVRHLAVVLLPPDLRAAFDVRQRGPDDDRVATHDDLTGHDAPHVQVMADDHRVGVLRPVAERGAAGDDLEAGELREVVDDRLADSLAQVVAVRIAGGVEEGKDGDRIDRVAEHPAARRDDDACRNQRQQDGRDDQ